MLLLIKFVLQNLGLEIMKYNITSAGPSITQSEIDLVEAISIGWQDNRNLHIDQFVEEFGAYVNRKFILPTSHCTGQFI